MNPAFHLVLGIGLPHGMEWLWIAVVALLIFGRRLPEVMRNLGGSVREFKKGMDSPSTPQADVNPYAPPTTPRVEGSVPRDATQPAAVPQPQPQPPPEAPPAAPPANGQPR